MDNLIGINPKIKDFIKTLTPTEKKELWFVVNTPHYVGMIADEFKKETEAEIDALKMEVF